jgi:hypothetical protein
MNWQWHRQLEDNVIQFSRKSVLGFLHNEPMNHISTLSSLALQWQRKYLGPIHQCSFFGSPFLYHLKFVTKACQIEACVLSIFAY